MSHLSIDTLKIRIPAPDIMQMLQSMSNIEWQHTVSKDGEIKFSKGRCDNILLNLYCGNLYIEGSIPRFVNGDNVTGLSFTEFTEGVKVLENTLNINLGEGVVTRIDIAASIPVKEAPYKYIECLEYSPRFTKNIVTKDSIQFMQKEKMLKFYDKVLEIRSKDSNRICDSNLLRYEFVLKYNAIKRMFGNQFTLNDLLVPKNYSHLIFEYAKRYNSVIKSRYEYLSPQSIVKPSQIINYLASVGLDSIGLDNIFKIIKRTPALHNNFHKRMKDAVKAITNQSYTINSPLIEEFEEKLEQLCLDALCDLTLIPTEHTYTL